MGSMETQERTAASRTPARLALTEVDRSYFAWFGGLTLLILLFRQRLPSWPEYIALHAAVLLGITLLACERPQSKPLRLLHDWYPLAVFIICFEEVSRLSLLVVEHWQDAYLLSFERRLLGTDPTLWLQQFASPAVTEVLEVGYFSYFLLLIVVGGVLYRRRDKRPFREVMMASVASYIACYVVFICWPTEGPAHTLRELHTVSLPGGPFHWAVMLIQKHAGVHGNAFPSSHVAAGVVALIFAWRYTRWLGVWLTPLVVLLCVGAVYDGYHYASDVFAGIIVGVIAAAAVIARKAAGR